MAKFPISKSLQVTVEQNPHIDAVHFTADGHHHFRVFECAKKLYSRLHEVPKLTKGGVSTLKKVLAPIKDRNNQDDSRYAIVETMERDEVLKATPVVDPVESAIKKAEILSMFDVTEEEFAEVLKSVRKSKK